MLAQLLSAIRTVRPTLTLRPRAIVEAICLSEGAIGSAQGVAHHLGLSNRFKLARMLEQEGLPPLHRLSKWATVLSWVVAAEREDASLCELAFRSHRHPSACYRLIKEITGLRWKTLRARGSGWVQRQLLKEFDAVAHAEARVSWGR